MDANSIVQLVTNNWHIIAFILGACGASKLQQYIKRWFSLQSPKVLIFVTITLSFVGAVVPAALDWYHVNAQNVGGTLGVFFTLMTVFYRYALPYLTKECKDIEDQQKVAEAQKIEKENLIASVPSEVLNTATEQTENKPFEL